MYIVTVLFCTVGMAYCTNLVGRKAGFGSKPHFVTIAVTTLLMISLLGFAWGVGFGLVIGLASGTVLATAKLVVGGIFKLFSYLGEKGYLGKSDAVSEAK